MADSQLREKAAFKNKQKVYCSPILKVRALKSDYWS